LPREFILMNDIEINLLSWVKTIRIKNGAEINAIMDRDIKA